MLFLADGMNLRGEYMYENAELEDLLRRKCPDYPEDKPYRELVKNYFIHENKSIQMTFCR